MDGHFFNEKAKGWHWYQAEPGPEKRARDEQRDIASTRDDPWTQTKHKPKTATEELAERRKQLDEALAEATLRPSPKNVARFQKLQQKWVSHSERFSKSWMQNLLNQPELDATVKNPATQFGIQIQKEAEQLNLEKRVKQLSTTHGLFFIYQGKCQFCKGMALIVKQLSEKYGWKVLGISQDGEGLPEFPESRYENGISEAWGIKGVPAVFVVNPETEQVIPIGHGLISLEQLEHNLMRQVGRSE